MRDNVPWHVEKDGEQVILNINGQENYMSPAIAKEMATELRKNSGEVSVERVFEK